MTIGLILEGVTHVADISDRARVRRTFWIAGLSCFCDSDSWRFFPVLPIRRDGSVSIYHPWASVAICYGRFVPAASIISEQAKRLELTFHCAHRPTPQNEWARVCRAITERDVFV